MANGDTRRNRYAPNGYGAGGVDQIGDREGGPSGGNDDAAIIGCVTVKGGGPVVGSYRSYRSGGEGAVDLAHLLLLAKSDPFSVGISATGGRAIVRQSIRKSGVHEA